MSKLRNSVSLIGNTGKDIDYKVLDDGKQFAKVSLATKETYHDSENNKITKTEWHNLIVWGKAAKSFADYVKKGNKIAIEGKLTTNTYTNDEGKVFYNTVIVVREFEFLTPKNS